jgi:predicted TPR repeat methyltransferase
MPLDALQIALEHHRAGRLAQAENWYRQAIERDAANADALHWLGVLMHQAARPDDAVPLLERAVSLRPDDAAFAHNLGHAYLARRHHEQAASAFGRAVALDPSRAQGWMGLGLARLSRGEAADREGSVQAFREARSRGLDTPELHRQLAAAALMAGEVDEAIAAYEQALKREPDDAATLYHLALAHRAKGDVKAVRKTLMKAAEADPRFARAWFGLGALEAESQKWDLAAAMFRRAIAVKDDYAAAYRALSQVLEEGGRVDEAERVGQQAEWAARAQAASSHRDPGSVADLERRVTPSGDAADLQFGLASALHLIPPNAVPTDSLVELFDRYAENFDEHLREKLQYRVPELIAEALRSPAVAAERSLDVLDLGCGTGLCGALLRPVARTMVGVDLSPKMIEQARARGTYDRLEVGEIVRVLAATPAESFDLVVAADVLIYLGDLSPVFEGVAACLRRGGRFAFSVEAGAGDRYVLQQNRRFAHAKPYVQRLANMYGFHEASFELVAARLEAEKTVRGYVVVLSKP